MLFAFFEVAPTAAGKFVVHEIVEAPRTLDGVSYHLWELYHPSLVIAAHACDDTVQVGDLYDVELGTYETPGV